MWDNSEGWRQWYWGQMYTFFCWIHLIFYFFQLGFLSPPPPPHNWWSFLGEKQNAFFFKENTVQLGFEKAPLGYFFPCNFFISISSKHLHQSYCLSWLKQSYKYYDLYRHFSLFISWLGKTMGFQKNKIGHTVPPCGSAESDLPDSPAWYKSIDCQSCMVMFEIGRNHSNRLEWKIHVR